MNRARFYVGYKAGLRTIFRSYDTPTPEVWGETFTGVIGPFRTLAGAEFMRDYGANNPHCQCVADAERLAKLETQKESQS